ncbi:hypothetical protein GCM10007920_27170 [Ciceribacter naphthalenivorans]|uniref:Uncharacterized protein n=2 Tax=Alphaproteobacteria TaxID=28211 RepID=A0A512HHR5_9HYPH|nr:hypothetical protein RNA01_19270 [Ciceribacter naphthalenivorans]GLR22929.1 hypothetical protein GCM10007920_27170 [Ciceribacter naphthalenivorans]GLT05785.1 hypothetical protein GCM10007926_27170 [Sphingomonas psychrolutea]
MALWQAAASGNAQADYQAYLAAYTTGKFVAIANNRIAGLTKTAPAPLPSSSRRHRPPLPSRSPPA